MNIDVREKHVLVTFSYTLQLGMVRTTRVSALTGDGTHDPSVYEMVFQPTEPHRPGDNIFYCLKMTSQICSSLTIIKTQIYY